jgi:hypothetical protein
VIDARIAPASAHFTGAITATLAQIPRELKICFDRGPACAESREKNVANSLRISGDERRAGRPLEARAVVCFKQVRLKDCGGSGSARLVLVAELQRLVLELTPGHGGYVYVNTAPHYALNAAGLPISGDIGYFSSDRQRACLKLPRAAFTRRKYFRPPPGRAVYGEGGGYSVTLFGEPPTIVCDEKKAGKGFEPRALPDVVLPAQPFSRHAGG